MTEMAEVTVGVVGRAHGVRGELGIILRTDEPERRFAVGATVLTPEGRQLVVAQSREVSGRLLVRFEQVTDRNQSRAVARHRTGRPGPGVRGTQRRRGGLRPPVDRP